MSGVHLTGLEGTNPMGFLAGLGVQVIFAEELEQPCLWWSDDITPHAIVDGAFTVERIADQATQAFTRWKCAAALNPRASDGSAMRKGDELKLLPEEIRTYLSQAVRADSGGTLATALLAEGSLDNKGVAKPSDFYFSAAHQKFLDIARRILNAAGREEIVSTLQGPWSYESEIPSLGWDVTDDRVYALRASKPNSEKKLTNPGPEALALLGISLYPVFAGRDRTDTQGCSGSWRAGYFSWPLWNRPSSLFAVRSLLAHAYDHPGALDRSRWFHSWGISTILRSPIRRTDEGGFGTFAPSEVKWYSRNR